MSKFWYFGVICSLIISCSVKYFSAPNYFPETVYDFKNNPLKTEKIELGRTLFYDPILSKDSTISCASCHSVYNSFAHSDHSLSHGIKDKIGTRNAPALINLAWNKAFMWDGAINHLDRQALAPITNAIEMDEALPNVMLKLQKNEKYQQLFYKAFGNKEITTEKIVQSLSQFQLTITSTKSKYDSVKLHQAKFTEQESKGYYLFQKNCNSCHTEPLFTNNMYEKNALPIDKKLNDLGRMKITQNKNDSLLFKVPTLRNLAFTFPYMHDGRFKKLSEVLNHYTKNIPDNYSEKLNHSIILTSNEKVDLIAFLQTLNDDSFMYNKNLQDPKQNFRRKK